MLSKQCTCCKKDLLLENFTSNTTSKDGLEYRCKSCKKEYRLKNRNQIRKNYNLGYKLKYKKNIKNYSIKNKDIIAKRHKLYNIKNKEKLKLYRINNKGRVLECKLKRVYNLSLLEYKTMLENQNNQCKICKKVFDNEALNTIPHVDHNHITGKIRGLLCHKCNSLLGYSNDNINILDEAIKYLKEEV